MKISERYTKGFTLVELLVVIAIVAVLAGALFLVINPAELLKKGRDSKRMSELQELNKALASAMASSSSFTLAVRADSSCSNNSRSSAGGSGSYIQYTSDPAGALQNFLPILPIDPRNGNYLSGSSGTQFCYYFAANAQNQWEINAIVESSDGAKYAESDGGTANNCSGSGVSLPNANCRFEVGTSLSIIP